MGANARRRHGVIRAGRLSALSDSDFMHLARSSCSRCGSAELEWVTLGTLPSTAPTEVRQYAAELRPQLGASAAFWWCTSCTEAGAFEQELH